MAVADCLPEISGQTYQRYIPGVRAWVRRPTFQRDGTVTDGPCVSASNTFDAPRKSSTWYPDAAGAGAHAKRCDAVVGGAGRMVE